MFLEAVIRRFVKSAGTRELRLTQLESLAVAHVELDLVELARSGKLFHGGLQLAANGIDPDTALPTTTAKLGLYNSDADGGRTIFVDLLHHWLASGTPAVGSTLWACISNGKLATAVAAMATGFGIGPTHGRAAASVGKWGTAITLPAGTVWASVGGSLQPATASIGLSDQPFQIRGALAIPPGHAMGLAVISPAGTTPKYGISCRQAELEADIE